jgi:hypothetical protein
MNLQVNTWQYLREIWLATERFGDYIDYMDYPVVFMFRLLNQNFLLLIVDFTTIHKSETVIVTQHRNQLYMKGGYYKFTSSRYKYIVFIFLD